MSQADALLASLNDEEMATYSVDSSTEEHIVIDNDRFITVPEKLKRIAVEHDHDIETVTFDCPRYWNNHDMSEMTVYINYMLPDGTKDAYIAENITVDGDNDDVMHFDWTIGNNMTKNKGNISFLVCVIKTDADGNEEKHWNSELNRDLYISEGLEVVPSVVMDYPDIVTQLLERMTSVEDVCVTAEEAKHWAEEAQTAADGVFGDYVATQRYVQQCSGIYGSVKEIETNLGNGFANPITGSAEGSVIRVDDVSPIAHTAKAKIANNNLIPFPYADTTKTEKGITFTVNDDGSIHAEGTATGGNAYFAICDILYTPYENATVYFSGCPSGGSSSTYFMFCLANGAVYDYGEGKIIENVSSIQNIQICIPMNKTVDATFKPMINVGSEPKPYNVNVDPTSIKVHACGANLVDVDDFTVERTNSWSSKHVGDFELPSGTYTARLNFVQEGDITHVALSARKYGLAEVMYANVLNKNVSGEMSMTFTIPDGETGVTLYVYSNNTAVVLNTKCTFSDIRVEAGSTAGDYEAYNHSEYTPTSDGAVDIQAVSPTMTVFSNTPGVNLEVEYNRDATVIVDEIHTKLDDILTRVAALETLHG